MPRPKDRGHPAGHAQAADRAVRPLGQAAGQQPPGRHRIRIPELCDPERTLRIDSKVLEKAEAQAARSRTSSRSGCSPRAGTPRPSRRSWACARSPVSSSASRSSAAACGEPRMRSTRRPGRPASAPVAPARRSRHFPRGANTRSCGRAWFGSTTSTAPCCASNWTRWRPHHPQCGGYALAGADGADRRRQARRQADLGDRPRRSRAPVPHAEWRHGRRTTIWDSR